MQKDIVVSTSLIPFHKRERQVPLPPIKTIYILGTGPHGVEYYDAIPTTATVIGVNKAIMLHGGEDKLQSQYITERMKEAKAGSEYFKGVPMWLWLCSDVTLPEEEWFRYYSHLIVKCDFDVLDPYNPTAVFGKSPDGERSLHKKYPQVPYTFKHGLHLKKTPAYKPLWPGLRGGASIGAQAVQLAYWFGAENIILCGIDMMGDKYMDGSENKVKHMFEDGTSRHLPLFNGLCKWINTQPGRSVKSLSKTALDIERVKDCRIY
jgi:hypothetical protein